MKKLLLLSIFAFVSSTNPFGVMYNLGYIGGFDISIDSSSLNNSGTYKAINSITFNTTNLSNNGSITAGSVLTIRNSENISGNGSFSAPTISINTKIFSFTGSIEGNTLSIKTKRFTFTGSINCSHRCVITLEEPLPLDTLTHFTVSGSGEFIIFDQNHFRQILVKLPEKYFLEEVKAKMPESKRKEWFELCTSELRQTFKKNALQLSENDIHRIYDQLVHCAEKLYLPRSYALKELNKIADDFITYYEPLKDKTRNDTHLTIGALLTTAGLIAGAYGFTKSQPLIGGCGGIASLAGLVGLYYGLNPNYKENYEKSCALQAKLKALNS